MPNWLRKPSSCCGWVLYRCCHRNLVPLTLMSLRFYWLCSAPFALLWLRTVQGCYKQLGCRRCYYSRNMYFTPCKWFPPPAEDEAAACKLGLSSLPRPIGRNGTVKTEGVCSPPPLFSHEDPTQVQRWLLRFYLHPLHCARREAASVMDSSWVIQQDTLGDFSRSLSVTGAVRFSSVLFV